MSHMHIHTRKSWDARPWRDFTSQTFDGEAYIHHGAESDTDAKHVTDFTHAAEAMRGIQRFHMDTNGWSDIAYHYVVFQPRGRFDYANAFEGRPVSHVPAAQLNHNTGTLAICVYGTIDDNDKLQENTVGLIAYLLNRHQAKTVGGHRDVTQTDCPGNTLYSHLDGIAKAAGIRRYHH